MATTQADAELEENGVVHNNCGIETKENQPKQRTVSFNNDVHVKRIGASRESLGLPPEPPVRKEPLTYLSNQELKAEADKVRDEADSLICTSDLPSDRFNSLPNRKKPKIDTKPFPRRSTDEISIINTSIDGKNKNEVKTTVSRAASDAAARRRGKERTSLSTLFRRANRSTSPEVKATLSPKTKTNVKRSKSDVSDLKSNSKSSPNHSPLRKKTNGGSEENLTALKSKKVQLSPIIEVPPRSGLKKDLNKSLDSKINTYKVNPVEKPPRFRSPEKSRDVGVPKPPLRTKKAKIVGTTLKKKESETENRNPTIVIDEPDSGPMKDYDTTEIQKSLKESIERLKSLSSHNSDLYTSQLPADTLPHIKGQQVEHMVNILKDDTRSSTSPSKLLSSTNSYQPYSYTRPSISPEPNLFRRSFTPERTQTPVKMNSKKEVVYAQVLCNQGSDGSTKQTIHKSYSPIRSLKENEIDEGYGYEELKNTKQYATKNYNYEKSKEENHYEAIGSKRIVDSPISPRIKEFQTKSLFENIEPKYFNENSSFKQEKKYEGKTEGFEQIKKYSAEPEFSKDFNFNELSFRRELLEARTSNTPVEPRKPKSSLVSKYFDDNIEKRLKATEKYVDESSKYHYESYEKDGIGNSFTEREFRKNDNGNNHVERSVEKSQIGPNDRYLDSGIERYKSEERKIMPPEPEYEAPSLQSLQQRQNEYVEKKHRAETRFHATSQDVIDSRHRTVKNFKSSPDLIRQSDNIYENTSYMPKVKDYNSLERGKQKTYIREERLTQNKDTNDYQLDDKEGRMVDSGIENDFRKDFSEETHRYKTKYSDDYTPSSKVIAKERKHTEEMYQEQFFENGKLKDEYYEHRYNDHAPTERNIDDGSVYQPRMERLDESPIKNGEKLVGKPPKATAKKLTGLEKVKQLFSRDSSKKSKKERDISPLPPKSRRSYDDSPDRRSQTDELNRRYKEYRGSSDDEYRRSDSEVRDKSVNRSRMDREERVIQHQRRRLATPSPSRSLSREPEENKGSWFKSLDRISNKKKKTSKVTKDREVRTEDEASDNTKSLLKTKSKSQKNVSYFNEAESEPHYGSRTSNKLAKPHADEFGNMHLSNKSYSMNNLSNGEVRKTYEHRTYRRNLQNISEIHSNSETESHNRRKLRDGSRSRNEYSLKPPMSPDRRSRSHSNSKTVRKSTTPLRGSKSSLRDEEVRKSSSELRSSKQDVRGSRGDMRSRRRTPGTASGESSTEGESNQSQRSVVYLHATTVGEIPDPDGLKTRSRDDVSSVRSSPLHVKTTTKSYSLLAPWRPRHHGEEYDVYYEQASKPSKKHIKDSSRPQSVLSGRNGHLSPNARSYSHSTLNRPSSQKPPSRLSNSSTNLYKKGRSSSKESINNSPRYERKGSVEIKVHREGSEEQLAKSGKKVGWFKMSNKGKKLENTRVR